MKLPSIPQRFAWQNILPHWVCFPSWRFPPLQRNRPQRPEPTPPASLEIPPPPRELLRGQEVYELPLLGRSVDEETNTPLTALYRIYEHIMLDQYIHIRNEIEAFWFQSDWKVCEIPGPQDPDPERYATVSCIPALLCLAFNRRIELGLPRDAPPIFTYHQLAEWRAQERHYETEPVWAEVVPPLQETLAIPHWDNDKRQFVPLETFQDKRASKQFAAKNILIWQPHIHFI